MTPSSLEGQRNAVKSLWQQNVHNTKEIGDSSTRYASLLRKTRKLSINHSSGCSRKLTPKKRRHIGKILNAITSLQQANLRLLNGLYVVSSIISISFSVLPRKIPFL